MLIFKNLLPKMEYLNAIMSANNHCEFYFDNMTDEEYYRNLIKAMQYKAKIEREELLESLVERDRSIKNALKRSNKFNCKTKFQNPNLIKKRY